MALPKRDDVEPYPAQSAGASHPGPATVEEYFELDDASEIRHEYAQGEIMALASSSFEHDTISNNLRYELRRRLRNGPSSSCS